MQFATSWPYAPTFWIGVPPTVPGIPDRHSRPARPRATQSATVSSQDSPAPAVRSVSVPSRACSRPRTSTCTTRPSKPASAITRLLPPPRTNSGAPFDLLQRCARSTSSTVRARSSHRAGPPTPSVVSGASGSPSTAPPSASIEGKEPCFLCHERRECFRPRAHAEFNPVPRRELGGERNVGGNDNGELRVSAGGLVVGEKKNRLARWRHLNTAREGGVRNHLLLQQTRDLIALQAISHPIRLRRDDESRALQQIHRISRKILGLRTCEYAQPCAAPAPVCGRLGDRLAAAVRRALGAESQSISLQQRAALGAAHSAQQVCGPAAEHAWNIDAAVHRHICPRAKRTRVEAQDTACGSGDGRAVRYSDTVEGGAEIRAGDRER